MIAKCDHLDVLACLPCAETTGTGDIQKYKNYISKPVYTLKFFLNLPRP